MRDFPGREALVGSALRALRAVWPGEGLTFPLGQHGRLGNQLFQIAGTYAIARRLRTGVVFPDDWPYRPFFSLPDDWFGGRLAVLRCRTAISHATEIPREWREYLQNIALWDGREEEIRLLMQPSPYAFSEAEARYGDLLAIPRKTSLHVRRGDYTQPDIPHQLCPPAYYEMALGLIAAEDPGTQLVVFSDDAEWCRREFRFEDAIFVEGNPDWLDLTLMSRCEHHVCANSTFSWWGAFLSEDPSPIVPWLVGTLPEELRVVHPPHWRELVLEA